MSDTEGRTRRHDPERRERIMRATLDVIAEQGTQGVTHRRVAARADVPLGSMTYHFAGMDDLLQHSFSLYAQQVGDHFDAIIAPANSPEQACKALTDYIFSPFWEQPRHITLMMELYSYVSCNPDMREQVKRWLEGGRHWLMRHFDEATAVGLDAFVEGLLIHRVVAPAYMPRERVHILIRRLGHCTD